jgi:hypothetical protein
MLTAEELKAKHYGDWIAIAFVLAMLALLFLSGCRSVEVRVQAAKHMHSGLRAHRCPCGALHDPSKPPTVPAKMRVVLQAVQRHNCLCGALHAGRQVLVRRCY